MREPHRVVVDGETRQVYARDRTAPLGTRFVYLPEGEAPRFRSRCDGGALICPVPDCPDPRYRAVGGEIRRHHFRHVVAPKVPHAPESFQHLCAKDLMAAWLADRGADVMLEDRSANEMRPDILARFADGSEQAVEIQYTAIGIAEWRVRQRRYERRGLNVVWLFGHLPPYLSWRHAIPLTVASTALLTEAEAAGVELRWIDPENQVIISATRADQDRVPFKVRSREIAVARHRLEDCAIVDGVFTTPSDERDRRARAAAVELAAEAARLAASAPPVEVRPRPASTVDTSASTLAAVPSASRRREDSKRLRERTAQRWLEVRPGLVEQFGPVPGVIEDRLPTDDDVPSDHAYWHWSFCEKLLGRGPGAVVTLREAADFFPERVVPDRGAAYRAVLGFLVALRDAGYIEFPWVRGRGHVPFTVLTSPFGVHPLGAESETPGSSWPERQRSLPLS